ncbi:hypothetical protein COV61_02465 [Candidatus Micrarchaeota archaeon CG11_big_fil_rev_8_21_14_0_20_47_5]|nr:MAG: hypothetical protein COV61_02465 [Candidatus Micrarchaeota archaeon CG11_big_fil_rev_8_21_14_0_20_47_5]
MPNQTEVAKIIVVEKPAPNNISIVVRERTQNWLVDEFIFEAVGNFASTLSFQAPNGDNTDAIGYKEIGGMNATPYGVQNAPFVSRKNSTFLSLSSNSVEFLMSFFGNGSGNATQTGTLSVSTVPLAAFVYVDGAYAGMTTSVANVTVSNLSVGNHSVLVRREGFQNYETTACIYAGQTTYVIAYLNQSNGTLDVSSSPSGATIWTLNLKTENREVYGGLTPNTISLPAGKYRIRLVKEGYDMPSFMVAINADQVSTLNVVLLKVVSTSAHKKTGTLNIDSTPSGASVYINDVYQGTAPYTVILQGGSYAIKLKKEGHYDYLTAAYMPGIKYIPGGNYTYTGSINAVLTRLGDGER